MDLKPRMEMAGKNLLDCLSAACDYLPYWSLGIDDDRRAEFRMTSPNHNIGRWWDAVLRLEDATGFVVPAHLEGGMLGNTYAFFDNPDQVCFAPLRPELGEPIFEIHSLREGLLALNALARYRGSEWAVEQGHRMLESVGRLSDDDGNWEIAIAYNIILFLLYNKLPNGDKSEGVRGGEGAKTYPKPYQIMPQPSPNHAEILPYFTRKNK